MHAVVQCLTEARARVERRWIQGAGTDYQGGVCTAAAVETVYAEHEWDGDVRLVALLLIEDAIRRRHGGWLVHPTIPMWNDSPERTKAQVLAVFDEAIAVAEKRYPANEPERVVTTPPVHAVSLPVSVSLMPVEFPEPKVTVMDKIRELVGV